MKLRWYIDGNISRSKTQVGGTYVLDADYKPIRVDITARLSGVGGNTVIDINDDGVSIFDSNPALSEYQTSKAWTTIPFNTLRKNSVITLDIDSVNTQDTIRDLTVEMEVESV